MKQIVSQVQLLDVYARFEIFRCQMFYAVIREIEMYRVQRNDGRNSLEMNTNSTYDVDSIDLFITIQMVRAIWNLRTVMSDSLMQTKDYKIGIHFN